jgi:putative transposase
MGFMIRSGVIDDGLWAVIEPVLPCGVGRQGRPWNDHRLMLEGICWRFRTGCPWRDLPAAFGPWQTVWKRHRRWSADGTYERMFAAVRAACPDPAVAEDMLRLLSADSTSVRAHQHAAGAPRVKRG